MGSDLTAWQCMLRKADKMQANVGENQRIRIWTANYLFALKEQIKKEITGGEIHSSSVQLAAAETSFPFCLKQEQ